MTEGDPWRNPGDSFISSLFNVVWLLSLRLNSQKHHKIPQAQNITVVRSSFSICVCHANEGLAGLRRQVTFNAEYLLIVVNKRATGS